MEFSKEQQAALEKVYSWYNKGQEQVFRLFGYAGTGKSTLAKEIAGSCCPSVQFAAFTGKAAQILREKGADNAKTIHSLIYYRVDGEDEEGKFDPSFVLKRQSKISNVDLVIIDECSMVDEQLGQDLLSFCKPILVLGDPAQLPPPKGCGFFTKGSPDFLLTEVFRQAADNPILAFATDIRMGKDWTYGDYGALKIISRKELKAEQVLEADQVLVGRNQTRKDFNARIRQLKGFQTNLPEIGDKLVCLTNDHDLGLLNGSLWQVTEVGKLSDRRFARFAIVSEDGTERQRVKILRKAFEGSGTPIAYYEKKGCQEFDFGYALTVHKAQGSQWNHVILFDESQYFRETRYPWLYTGVTRAAKKLTLVR